MWLVCMILSMILLSVMMTIIKNHTNCDRMIAVIIQMLLSMQHMISSSLGSSVCFIVLKHKLFKKAITSVPNLWKAKEDLQRYENQTQSQLRFLSSQFYSKLIHQELDPRSPFQPLCLSAKDDPPDRESFRALKLSGLESFRVLKINTSFNQPLNDLGFTHESRDYK